MGSQPSKPVLSNVEKELVCTMRSLVVDDMEEYVDLGAEKPMDEKQHPKSRKEREPEELPLDKSSSVQSDILKNPKNRLALTALSSANPRQVLTCLSTEVANQQVFNIKIPFEGGPITNQRSSGRCWLFASTNVFRVALMKKYKLDTFQLSQAYLFFWDKLEKSNWFLEQIVDTADEDLESRLVQALLSDIVSDGGQWDMVYNLVSKYGLVPQTLYPDSWTAKNSGIVNAVVKTKLREYALVLRDMCKKNVSASTLSSAKGKMMQEIQLILTVTMGPPPSASEPFTWQYLDKSGKAHELTTTPVDFAKDIYSTELRIDSSIIEGMVSLVHDPRHAFYSLLTVSRLGNIVGGRGINYVNVPMSGIKSACIAMLKHGYPVFFGSDVGQFSDRQSGVMDLDLFDYELGLGTSLLKMDKAARLRTGESRMTHAMVLTAVHLDEKTGKSVRWRVQNSWGEDVGDKGWFVMSDRWMDEFVYQVVIDPRILSKDVKDVLGKKPIVLPLWDPMGSLA